MNKTIKKAAVTVMMTAFAAAAALPLPAYAPFGVSVSAEEISVSTQDELLEQIAANPSGTIMVTANIELTTAVSIENAVDLTIDLGGYTISKPTSATALSVFQLKPSCSKVTITNGTIDNGYASGNYGGGIYVEGTSTELVLDKLTINKCYAAGGFGGGVYMPGGTLIMTDCILKGNSAKDGAGVYMEAGTLTMTGCSFSENIATGNGGGIFAGKEVYAEGEDTLTFAEGVTITGNEAENGGGIYSNAPLKVTGADITDNTAKRAGGGLYITSGMEITSGAIDDNKATVSGGGICFLRADSNADISLAGGSVLRNTARNGAGVYTDAGIVVQGSMIDGNIATNYGGGIQATNSETTVTLLSGSVSNNAAKNGGGIYASSYVNIPTGKTEITGNTATGLGGGIYAARTQDEGDGNHAVNITTSQPYIYDNTNTGKSRPDNLYLAADQPIFLGFEFDSDSKKIGVSMRSGGGVFTSGAVYDANTTGTSVIRWAKHDPAYYFTSDDPNYKVAQKKASVNEAYLIKATAKPVSLDTYAKIRFEWSEDGTECVLYGLKDGKWKKIGNAEINRNTATYGDLTDTKTEVTEPEVTVNFVKGSNGKNKLTLHFVCTSGNDEVIGEMGFVLVIVDENGSKINEYSVDNTPLKREDINAVSASYDVSVSVLDDGRGVKVKPYYRTKAADSETAELGTPIYTDVYGTFYVDE